MAQENKLLARNNKTGLRLFSKCQFRFPCRGRGRNRRRPWYHPKGAPGPFAPLGKRLNMGRRAGLRRFARSSSQ
jgi:hypothetical protein